jgi:hypothetical protein
MRDERLDSLTIEAAFKSVIFFLSLNSSFSAYLLASSTS